MDDTRIAVFESHRCYLLAIAYRMLGAVSEAEDFVQEAYLCWRNAPVDVRSPKAWLATTVARLCLNHLKSARVRRVLYFGPWLPEPVITGGDESNAATDGATKAALADSLSLALLVVLETLSPTERVVFVLREVFDYEFSDIARIVETNEVNCRKLLARARARVRERRPRFDAPTPQRERVFEEFTQAVQNGNPEDLLELLSPDVAFVSDGGGRARALPLPIAGAGKVARLLASVMKKFVPAHRSFRRVSINGLPGMVGCERGRIVQVLAIGITAGRVSRIYVITNPAKLRHLETQVAPGSRTPAETGVAKSGAGRGVC